MGDPDQRTFVSYCVFDGADRRTVVSEGNGNSGEVMVVVDHQKREVFVDRRYAGVFEKGDLKEAIPAKARDGNYARADADLNEPPLSYTEPRKPASLEPKDAQQG